ncbi:trypsin-like serine protease [Streptomyces goshikiensis]|uniref:trypsin-like serine protease n=1 Tax=Streptomyces goshikiensis TaxID=1942 RepID=UPI00382474A5
MFLVLARLAEPAKGVAGVAGVKRAVAAPAVGAALTAVGFGRTKTEWVPEKAHVGAFTVDSSAATSPAITGKGTDAICKGDTGGPLLNAAGELVGVNSRSWQGGCLGVPTTETRTGAVSSRIDDLGAWIQETILRSIVQRDLNDDGRSDVAMVYRHADTSIGFSSSLTNASGEFGEFTAGYKVPAGSWDWSSMKLVTGDFNGDRRPGTDEVTARLVAEGVDGARDIHTPTAVPRAAAGLPLAHSYASAPRPSLSRPRRSAARAPQGWFQRWR